MSAADTMLSGRMRDFVREVVPAARHAPTRALRLETWLRNRKVRGAEALATAALDAAERQHTA
ncbi:IS110 family transposase, partial [Kitasatospora sp. NPDC101155]